MNSVAHFSCYWPIRFVFCCGLIATILSTSDLQASARRLSSPPSEQNVPQASVPSGAFQDGLAALKENRPADALAYLTAAEQQHPDDPRVHNFRGIALAQLEHASEAATEYEAAIRLDPKMADAYRNLGFLNWNARQLEDARQHLERATMLAPDDQFAHYYLGRVLLDQQKLAPALREFDLARLALPDDPGFSLQLAAAYARVQRTPNATTLLDRVATLTLAPPQRFNLALSYLLTGQYENSIAQARKYLAAALPGDSDSAASARAWSLIGISAAHTSETQRSVDALRKAASLQPTNEEWWLNLTRELMELSRFPEAVAAAQEALVALPSSYALHLRLGAAQLAAGHYAEAENAFRDLVSAGDPLPTGYVGLAQVLLRTGRAEEAVSLLSDARQKLGDSFLIDYFLGMAFERAARSSEALQAFQIAEKLNPDNAEIHISIGKAQLALAHTAEAIAEFQLALKLSPGHVQAARLLTQASRRAGKSVDAGSAAEATTMAPDDQPRDLIGDFFIPQWQDASAAP
jgi:tetratricopeptide (TPR) repeat protein